MSFYEAFKDRWKAFGDIEDVTYTDTAGAQASVKARPIEPKQELLAMIDGIAAMQGDYVTFNLWAVSLGGKVPATGGVVTQVSGDKWRVKAVMAAQYKTQYHCLCVKHK